MRPLPYPSSEQALRRECRAAGCILLLGVRACCGGNVGTGALLAGASRSPRQSEDKDKFASHI